MKTQFLPIDYDYFDFEGRNYMLIIGRNEKGRRMAIIDTCPVYFWAILDEGIKDKKTKEIMAKISKIKLDVKGRKTSVEKVELCDKNFLGKPVKALKIYATNYKDLHDIADQLGMPEIEMRRGYDLGFATHYIMEKKIIPLNWYEISGEVLDHSEEFGKIGMHLDVDMCIKLLEKKEIADSDKKISFEPKV